MGFMNHRLSAFLHKSETLLLAGLLLVASAPAQPPLAASGTSLMPRTGEEIARFCRHCHGDTGISTHPEIPNLASQNPAYLLDQMNKIAASQRKSVPMEGLIKALKPEERANIALYFSQQKVLPQQAKDTAGTEAGRNLYAKLCVYCHGANAYGSDNIPRLAGQQTLYLQLSLKRYRSGNGERIDPRMQSYTRNLKDNDIDNLAAYLASLR